MNITIKPLTPNLIRDYLNFFDHTVFTENPDWAKCYCYSFHFVGEKEEWNREQNRASVIQLIKDGRMKGYLVYSDEEPIGWCNVNDRLNYQRLNKVYDLKNNPADQACSIVCFLIRPDFRRQGIARKFLRQIVKDYTSLGYDYIEAYPGKGDLSDERHYKGPLSMYEKMGFKIVEEYDKYFVIRKSLNQ